MTRRSWVPALALLFLLAQPASAVEVRFDEAVDFSQYSTYAWAKGTPAARAEVQRWIEDAIDRELQSKGLRPAPAETADLLVVTVTFAETDTAERGNQVYSDRWDIALYTNDVVADTTGHLMIDLVDRETDQPVWRGVAEAKVDDRELAKVRKKIERLTRKLFRDFPPRPGS